MGGENDLFLVSKDDTPGSSPRGRGKLKQAAAVFQTERLIPAWAGKTGHLIGIGKFWSAHPRVGGEN